ncbi:MAG: MFS transporter [Myxococcota bacterium]
MNIAARFSALRAGFSRTFWVANILELFERFAFYGSKAILAVYLVDTVGLGPLGSTLVGLYGFAVFFLPILAGPIVDHYGFKRSLIACFSIFSIGYFAVGLAGIPQGRFLVDAIGLKAYVTGALLLTAVGGSLIKPCIVGTVACTTNDQTKSLGFSIYYMLVNLGGALGPALALFIREGFGIGYVLVMSSVVSLMNLIVTLVMFKEPESQVPANGRRTLRKVLKDMVLVFGNFRFISFLVIFSGFWIMFWQIFYSLPFYIRDVLHFERFELLETVDSWTIIVLTVPIAAAMKRFRPILTMTTGFAIASASWLIIAAVPGIFATVFAIFVFAIGEIVQAPRFYEYVADLAPKEQVGTFMGFAFLPVAIGALVAGPLSGYLVEHFIRQTGNPSGMWVVLSGIGFTSTALMFLYDRVVVLRKKS